MGRRGKIFLVIAILLLASSGINGCSSSPGPTNEDAIKVIQATIEADLKGQALKSPVVILEKGMKLPSGDWPVKVEYSFSKPDGTTEKKVTTYNLTPIIDSMGANSWNAAEAKK